MENFDRENIDELLEIHQIRQYFPPSKFCAVWYLGSNITNDSEATNEVGVRLGRQLELLDACNPPSLIARHSVCILEEVYIVLWCCLPCCMGQRLGW